MIIMPYRYEYLLVDNMQRTGASQNVKMLICVCVRFPRFTFCLVRVYMARVRIATSLLFIYSYRPEG